MVLTATNISNLYKSSLTVVNRDELYFSAEFHAHPEFELVYIEAGEGKRIVGNSVQTFQSDELTLIGPGLPHVWLSHKSKQTGAEMRSKAIVTYFNPKIFADSFYEMQETAALQSLFARAKWGIDIKGATKDKVVLQLKKLSTATGLEKIICLLEILHTVSVSNECHCINTNVMETARPISGRLAEVLNYIDLNIDKNISLSAVAKMTSLTPESFCRYFKQKTGKTFVDYLQETRIHRATQSLLNTDLTSAEIAYQTGFKTASGFNKLFKKFTGYCPTEYRKAAIMQ
jgi:AraC-like DNA-binding protein